MQKSTTKSFIQTQKLGQGLAKEILQKESGKKALVLGLQGDLGAGKTTFLQGFAKGLGVTEKINSPTFVILRRFKITKIKNQKSKIKITNQNSKFINFYHLDCYRLNKAEEILDLGFKEIISNPENIVAIEWPEKISKFLPKDMIEIIFNHLGGNKRELIITTQNIYGYK
ncbi:MAG: hypothetical protein A3A98_00415 [Candidatus Staskawiczbacteria bacterium RIFCSPLOWO2_01_FULL_40_39]|uniref:tRNA threonylcarbamoyladenosine biosynthesis protein TsaE n=1 Tax=Candidatus Staskawiczbacteria bacterium RIFCSPHIGHO2_01_FULL_39_25 TaxID=1802202 RepID=A0A1G2HMI1_9BACT|nr:MAG: hypothetical protein A2730_00415 [Candidatus Staskawiczbacteria bacterium RIFCSPHIGHO2_01_FULL_39_25]OGZ73199.1 MAG: hypothetical protein A3A98_00415 [Candidatus Staskawiczbacteria bacterium RIFCSPLOWO2_01_FULL_40_39]